MKIFEFSKSSQKGRRVSEESDTSSLAIRIRNGDTKAESELATHYQRSVRFIIFKRCNDMDLAQDITQETLMLVIQKARNGDIKNPDALSGFVRSTAVNLLIAHYRKEKRRETDEFDENALTDGQHNLEDEVANRQSIELVNSLIESLKTPRDKAILFMFYGEQKDKLDICRDLNLSSAHFDRVLYRAKNRLRQLHNAQLSVADGNADKGLIDA